MNESAVSKPIFYIKATEEKTKVSTPMFSVSGKISYPLVIWLQASHHKAAVVDFLPIPAQIYQEVLSLGHKKWGSEFDTLPKINT